MIPPRVIGYKDVCTQKDRNDFDPFLPQSKKDNTDDHCIGCEFQAHDSTDDKFQRRSHDADDHEYVHERANGEYGFGFAHRETSVF